MMYVISGHDDVTLGISRTNIYLFKFSNNVHFDEILTVGEPLLRLFFKPCKPLTLADLLLLKNIWKTTFNDYIVSAMGLFHDVRN